MSEVAERPSTKSAKPTLTLGQAADKIFDLREKKRKIEAELKKVEAAIFELTETIFGLLDEQDTRKAEGKKASISVNCAINPFTTKWDDTAKFIIKGKRGDKYAYAHLLYKRIAAPAYRELRSLGMVIPGQEDFINRTLSITKL